MSELAQKIMDLIDQYGHQSFAELSLAFPEHKGDCQLEIAKNLVIWAGMDETFWGAIEEIRPQTELKPTHWFVYLMDGRTLSLPLAKRPPKNGYKKPHWVTCVIRRKVQP